MANPINHIVVIGGGLAGLVASCTAADHGARVTLLDARSDLGGRARTTHHDGFSFNQGPHALYKRGAALPVLRALGVWPDGKVPALSGADMAVAGTIVRTARPTTLGTSGLRVLRAVAAPGAVKHARGRSMAEWIADLPDERARQVAAGFARLTSYCADLEHADAGAIIEQIRRGAKGVLYLHDGWGSLVDGLRAAALERGVDIRVDQKATAVVAAGEHWTVHTPTMSLTATAVVIAAGGPSHAAGILGGAAPRLDEWAATTRPVTAACLDVALFRLPNDRHRSIIGLDEPTYCIVHSRTARLAPDGGALIHVLRYGDDITDADELRASLESQLDRAQPGWRDVLVEARFSRRLIVAHDVPRISGGATRPEIDPGDVPGVFVAGDWITTNGLLADAAVDSGARAGLAAARAGLAGARSVPAHNTHTCL